jgi:hypothetical protein
VRVLRDARFVLRAPLPDDDAVDLNAVAVLLLELNQRLAQLEAPLRVGLGQVLCAELEDRARALDLGAPLLEARERDENTDDARFAVAVTRAEGWVCQFSPDAGLKLQGSCRTKRCDAPIGPFRAAWAALRVSSTVDRGDAAAARDRPTPPPAAALAQVEAAFDVGGADGWSDEGAGWSAVIPTELWEKFVPA